MLIITLVCCTAVLCTAYVFIWSHKALGDEANERSLHQGKKLTAGGLFVLLPWLSYVTWHSPEWSPLYGVWLLMLVGLADDVWEWSATPKFLAQCTAALILLSYFDYLSFSLWFLFLFVAIIWWLNLFNFMDGSNGIAGLHVVVVLAFYFLQFGTPYNEMSLMISVLLGSVVVFLVFNLILGRLFMGDAGSLPLAYIQAWLAIFALYNGWLTVPLVILLHASFVADASYTLIYRYKQKESLSQAHSTHFYQRWVKAGASHGQVAIVYAVMTMVCALLVGVLMARSMTLQWSVTAGIYLLLAVFFLKNLRLSR